MVCVLEVLIIKILIKNIRIMILTVNSRLINYELNLNILGMPWPVYKVYESKKVK